MRAEREPQRIISLAPFTTEIVYALGLGDRLVGVSHACDFPPEVAGKPRVTRVQVDDGACDSGVASPGSATLDGALLESLAPDLVLVPGLCAGCPGRHEVELAPAVGLPPSSRALTFAPRRLADVLSVVKTIGDFSGRMVQSRALIHDLRDQIDGVAGRSAGALALPRVLCLERLDPPVIGGHWIPEMIGLAGGFDGLGTAGLPSRRTTWAEIEAYRAEIFFVVGADEEIERMQLVLAEVAGSAQLRRLEASHLCRPGPRLYSTVEEMAAVIHPELIPARG